MKKERGHVPDCDRYVFDFGACSGIEYGGDDESYGDEGRSYCERCGLDGDG